MNVRHHNHWFSFASFGSSRPEVVAPAANGVPVIESLEGRTLMAAVTGVTLMNADTDQPIMALSNGGTINLATMPTRRLNLRADVDGATSSVRFRLDKRRPKTDNKSHFSLGAEKNGNFKPWKLPKHGAHTLTITGYELPRGKGVAGAPMTFAFNLVNMPLPAAPSSLAASVSGSQVALAWTDGGAGEEGYRIERSPDGTNFQQIATVGADVTSYGDLAVPAGTFHYRVCAYNAGGNTAYTNVATAGPIAGSSPTVPPAPASLLLATAASETRVVLSWVAGGGQDGYSIERSIDGINFNEIATIAGNVAAYADDGLSATTYHYRVWAFNDAGDASVPTNTASVTLTAPPSGPPTAASGLAAAASSPATIVLTWTDGGAGENGFRIERSLDGVTFTAVSTVAANVTSYTNTGLAAGTTYHYRVQAYNGAGAAPYSNTAVATTTQSQPAEDIRLVLVNADTDADVVTLTSGLTLDFNTLGTRNLNVRAEAGAAWQSVRFDLDAGGLIRVESTAPYAMAGDDAGGNYRPWTPVVGAHSLSVTPYTLDSAAGSAGATVTVTFTITDSAPPPSSVPAAPTGLAASTTSSTQIRLTWTDAANNETGYEVERSANGGSTYAKIATLASGTTSYNASGLSASTTYHFRVRATNATGPSGYSNTASATTSAPIPAPEPTARPGSANTGPTTPSSLQPLSGSTINQAGAVIEGFSASGTVTIAANNVTLRNFKIDASGDFYGIQINSGVTGTVIEDGEIKGPSSAALFGGNFIARRLHLWHLGSDGIKPTGNVLVEACWIERLGWAAGAHADGVQIVEGRNFTFRGNFFDMPHWLSGYNPNAAFMIQTNNGPIDNVVIEGNWMNGGNFTIQSRERSYGAPTNVRIAGNWFGRDYQFGTDARDGDSEWVDNRWWDTFELIPD